MIHWAWIIVALLVGAIVSFFIVGSAVSTTLDDKYQEGYKQGYLDRSMKELKKRQEDEQ